jgi:thymidine phosphorylase
MNEPLGYAIGNWNEIEECAAIMNPKLRVNEVSNDLIEVTLTLAGAMLMLGGKCSTIESGIDLAKEKIANGECWNKFLQMVELQGGDVSYFTSSKPYPRAKAQEEVTGDEDGYVSKLDALQFGIAAVNLGCGRKKVEDAIDYSSGIVMMKKVGDKINKGDLICLVYGESEEKIEHALEHINNAIVISSSPVSKINKIIEVIV